MQPLGKTVWYFLEMLNTDLSHDPVILGINQEKKKKKPTQTSTEVVTVPLFTIVKKWKNPDVYPLVNGKKCGIIVLKFVVCQPGRYGV